MNNDCNFQDLGGSELDRQTRADEAALREAFDRTAARSERGFASEAIAAAGSSAVFAVGSAVGSAAGSAAVSGARRTPAKRGWGTVAFPIVIAAAAIVLLGLLLRAPNEARPQSAGGAPGVFAKGVAGVADKPAARSVWHVPPSCVEVRRRDLQRRLERKRKRLDHFIPILLNPQAVPEPAQPGNTPS